MKATNRHRTAAFGHGVAWACLLVTSGVSAPALGQANAGDSERANLLFKKGKMAFNDGNYSAALRIYGEAWSLKQSPDIAANLAQTESELGRHRDAAEHFAFALAHLLPSTTDDQKKALAEGLDLEKKEVGTLHVTLEPAGAALSIDDIPVALPASGDLFVEPGQHQCSVTQEGYEANQQAVQVSKGSAEVLWIRLLPLGPAPTVAATPPASERAVSAPPKLNEDAGRSPVPAWVGGGLVVAGAAVGVAFLLSANASQSDADRLKAGLMGVNPCGAGTPFASQCSALHDKNSAVDRARTLEVVGFAVAGAAAVGTALYLLWPHSSSGTAQTGAPTFAVVPGTTSLSLVGHF